MPIKLTQEALIHDLIKYVRETKEKQCRKEALG
jgi:hypothetical protein